MVSRHDRFAMDSGKGKKTDVLKGWKGKGRRTAALFTRKELSKFNILTKGRSFVEVMCGVTSRKYGDYCGRIKIFRDGSLRIKCECYKGCPADNMTLAEFKDHTAPPPGESRWKPGRIWTLTKVGKKPSLHKTCLLKYYKGSRKDYWNKLRPLRGRTVHRNEFIECAKCGKERRFILNTKEDCRAYHLASLGEKWTCADFPNQKMSCEDEDERGTKKRLKGCPRRPLCKGCSTCVCTGCKMCRFKDCGCRTCVDFILNAGDEISGDEEEDDQISEEEDRMSEAELARSYISS